jgi:amidase
MDVGVIGPLARDARDLALALDVLAGPDTARGVACRLALPSPRATSLAGYRIAAWLDDPYCAIDSELSAVYMQFIEALRTAGARINECVGPVPLATGHDVAQRLIQGAMSGWVPEQAFRSLLTRATSAVASDDTPPTRWARNITQRARDFQLALEERQQQQAVWANFFRDYDVLVCPVTPTAAIPHDQSQDVDARTITVNGRRRAYGDQFAWLQAIGVVHLPVVVAPVGRTSEGLPVGIQIVAPLLEDRTAIDVAERFADVLGGFQAPPGY